MAGFETLGELVDKNVIHVIEMRELRDAYGASRLGETIAANISKELAGYGLGHLPSPLPLLASEEVRLYRRGTAIGDIVTAVLEPSVGGDQRLIDYAENTDREIVTRIREVLDSY